MQDCASLVADKSWHLEKAYGFNFFPGTQRYLVFFSFIFWKSYCKSRVEVLVLFWEIICVICSRGFVAWRKRKKYFCCSRFYLVFLSLGHTSHAHYWSLSLSLATGLSPLSFLLSISLLVSPSSSLTLSGYWSSPPPSHFLSCHWFLPPVSLSLTINLSLPLSTDLSSLFCSLTVSIDLLSPFLSQLDPSLTLSFYRSLLPSLPPFPHPSFYCI